jgi:hypothetical protein
VPCSLVDLRLSEGGLVKLEAGRRGRRLVREGLSVVVGRLGRGLLERSADSFLVLAWALECLLLLLLRVCWLSLFFTEIWRATPFGVMKELPGPHSSDGVGPFNGSRRYSLA